MTHSNVSKIAQMVSLASLLMRLVYGTPIREASINVESSTGGKANPVMGRNSDDASGKVPMRDVSWRISSSTLSSGAYELDGSSVKVLHAGNYFIYAQVTFFTLVNYDSFQITVNGNPFVSCKSSQQVSLRECSKLTGVRRALCVETKFMTNSCFAGAVRRLQAGDKIKIERNQQTNRKVLVGPTNTFFGLTKF